MPSAKPMTDERLEELRQIAGGVGAPKSYWMDELIGEIDRLREQLTALLAFARDVLAGYVDPASYELGDLDGADLQDLATRHGLLVPETRHQPCGEGCRCADYYAADEWRDGITCFTPAEWVQRCGK